MPTKEELEKQVASLERKLVKAQARIDELEANAPAVVDDSAVFGANAVPLEQR